MPTPTYVAIAKTVLTGTQATITLSSIPSTYTDLVLLYSARTNSADQRNDVKIQINSLTTGYTDTVVYAETTTPASFRDVGATLDRIYNWAGTNGANSTSNTFTNVELYFPNYAGSTKKVVSATIVQENNSTTNFYYILMAQANLVDTTSAISSLTITSNTGSFVSGCRFDLYGIKNS